MTQQQQQIHQQVQRRYEAKLPSIGEIASSPLITSYELFRIRLVSLIAHMIVVFTGIYTRRRVFFIQFTNWTNILSLFYSISAFIMSYLYERPRFYKNVTMIKVNRRSRTSRMAWLTESLMQLTLPMHFIVTIIFWNLVYQTVDRNHGRYDDIYFLCSHGATLLFLLLDQFLSNIQFSRRIVIAQYIYVTIYAVFGMLIFKFTGYAIYDFMDYRKKQNLIVLMCLYVAVLLVNELVIALAKLRNIIMMSYFHAQPLQPRNRRRKIKLSKREKSFPENSF